MHSAYLWASERVELNRTVSESRKKPPSVSPPPLTAHTYRSVLRRPVPCVIRVFCVLRAGACWCACGCLRARPEPLGVSPSISPYMATEHRAFAVTGSGAHTTLLSGHVGQ
ncbi:hypothetical protein NQD34_001805 [Periophthalmus magnuspinnatus]|nr:hypothetical protein NQD34_001805 [Periophthalmus magnuspinnatus]